MAATYNKFDAFTFDVLDAKHDFGADTFKVLLTNVAPVAANSVKADLTEIAPGNGYPPGGVATTATASTASGVTKVVGSPIVLAAAGGTIGPFQYAVLYNDTSPTKPLIAWWDYGSPLTLLDTDTVTIAFDAMNGIFQMS